ncbi:hypothetical protein [Zhongshania sp.]|uniref:hypothetical protein n=1 Tax=Zhongshania sp. TaxID=1971902 RepID=UPI003569D845
MDFFKPTTEEIKEAVTGDRATFKHNEPVVLLVNEVKTREGDDPIKVIVGCKVVGGEQDGKDTALFIRDNAPSKKQWFALLNALFTPEKIVGGFAPSELVGKKVKTTAKVSAKEGKEFVNFYDFAEEGGAPDLKLASGGDAASGIPF